MKVFIDDIRTPVFEFDKVLRSSEEAIKYFKKNGCPDYISFDHDLGENNASMEIVKFLVQKDIDENHTFIPKDFDFYVHSSDSANPVGKANLNGYLHSYLKQRKLEKEF